MRIDEEKEHIYLMMRDITTERRKLSEMYSSLKERLDELNRLEQQGLDELNLKGYIDYYNESKIEQAKSNIEREAEHAINKINDDIKSIDKEEVIPKDVVSESKFRDRVRKGQLKPKVEKERKRTKRVNMKVVNSVVENILKESNEPIKVKDLYPMVLDRTKYDENELKPNNFRNNVMFRICEANPRIKKAGRAMYHYN